MLSPASNPERTLRRLDWTIVRRLDGLLQGDYRTLFRGQGLDLADIREYVAGDDVRNIDWNVTARLDLPHVREYLEDREISAHFLLDLLARRHETLAIRLTDPRERELPDIGFVIMTDSETGEALHIDTHDARFRKRFAEVVDRRERALGAAFRRAGVDTLELSTEEDLVRAVVRFAATRKLRRARQRAMGRAS